MTIKIALLKSGEQIIADIKEMISGSGDEGDVENRVIGYIFEFPYVVHLRNPELIIDKDKDAPIQLEISLFNWLPMSKDHTIPVPTNWVVTIYEPTKKVKDMYSNVLEKLKKNKENLKKIGEQNDQVDSATEQADSDKQD
jgi:hypothetical protein